jgi:eukaryotic translation initiation factor 2C
VTGANTEGRGRGRGAATSGDSSVGRGTDSPASSEGRGGRGNLAVRGGARGGQDSRGRGTFGGGGGRGAPRGRGGPPAAVIFAANTPARVDPRLSTADQLVAKFKQLTVKVSSCAPITNLP